MIPIIRYLKEGLLPKDKMEARKIQIRAARFIIIDDVLYRRGYSLPYLRCVNSKEADYVLREILSRKDASSRILLANPIERCVQHCLSMQQVLTLRKCANETRRDDDAHLLTMALCPMGN